MYLEVIYSLSEKTSFIAGLRYDGAKFSDNFRFDGNNLDAIEFKPDDISNVSPRIGMTHRLDNDFLFRSVYSEGFTYPNLSSYSRTFRVNEFLKSEGLELFDSQKTETKQSLELGLRGDLIDNELLFDFSIYYNRYKNNSSFVNFRSNPDILPGNLSIEDIPNDVFGIFTNLENDLDGYGSEFSLSWKPNNTFFANMSYSYAVPDHVDVQDNVTTGVAK